MKEVEGSVSKRKGTIYSKFSRQGGSGAEKKQSVHLLEEKNA